MMLQNETVCFLFRSQMKFSYIILKSIDNHDIRIGYQDAKIDLEKKYINAGAK